MKKLWMMLLISALMVLSAVAAESTVYVTDGGSGDGTTAASPLGSLADAYAALGDDGGKIIITDTVSIATSFVEPAHTGKVTLTGGTLAATDVHYMLNGPTTFEHITFRGDNKYLLIVAQFNPVVFGEGITQSGFGNYVTLLSSVCILGGTRTGFDKYNDNSLTDHDTNITVKSGKAIVVGYSYGVNKTYTGTAHIRIEGGTLCNIYTGSITGTGGNVKMTVTGGTFLYNVYSSAKSSKVAGNINIKITGGDFTSTSLTRFDGSMTGTGTTSVVDVSRFANRSTLLEKFESFSEIITERAYLDTVYVTDGGSGDGSSALTPCGSLAEAYAELGSGGGTIVITDTVSIATSFVEPAHTGKVTLTGGTLAATDVHYMLNGPTTFENITFRGDNKYLLIVAQFNPVVFGEGITETGFGTFINMLSSVCILGGTRAGFDKYNDDSLTDRDTSITVKSGKVIVVGFSYGVNKTYTGTAHIRIEGGTLCNVYLGSATGTGGSAEMNISGGTFIYNIYSNAKTSHLSGDVDVRITGGDFSASTLARFDGSVTGAGAVSTADLRGYADADEVVGKMEGFTSILTDPEAELAVTAVDAYADQFGFGNVRLLTEASVFAEAAVTGYGTYFIPFAVFTGDGEALERAVRVYAEGALYDGESFSADLLQIPPEFAEETILAISFCVIGGEEVTTAQYTFSVSELID